MDNDSRIIEIVLYLYVYSSDNHLISVADRAELEYSDRIQTQRWPALFEDLRWKGRSGMIFLLIWRAFNISSHLIIVWLYVSLAVFPILMVCHFLRTNPYKMSIFERSVTCSLFFRNCSLILTGTQGEKFEDMFLVKIASKGTSLN